MSKNKSVEILDLYEELYNLVDSIKKTSQSVSKKHETLSADIENKKREIEDITANSITDIKTSAQTELTKAEKSVEMVNSAMEKAESMLANFRLISGGMESLETILEDIERRISALEDNPPQESKPLDFQNIGTIEEVFELNHDILDNKVPVHRVNWTYNYWFLVESIQGDTAYGRTYNNGTWSSPYERSAKQGSYQLYERALNISAKE